MRDILCLFHAINFCLGLSDCGGEGGGKGEGKDQINPRISHHQPKFSCSRILDSFCIGLQVNSKTKVIAFICVCSIKDIIGYDCDDVLANNDIIGPDIIHPADSNILLPMKNYCE